MNSILKFTAFFLTFLCVSFQVNGQEFYLDGSMILNKISTKKKYGFEPNHKFSIKVGKISNQSAYMRALRGPNGEEVQFRRVASCCSFKSASAMMGVGLLDVYDVYHSGLEKPITLYLNGYDYEEPMAPVGFTFVTANEIKKPVIFPADSIVKVDFCNAAIQYAVEKEALLIDAVGPHIVPDENPSFEGGLPALKEYFSKHPLTDTRAENAIFRVGLAFTVDCNGNAGNFMIITKGKGVAETLANQVLGIVNDMPQNWKPALKDGEAVDCYQVLSFTVSSGSLEQVFYRE